MAGALTKGLKNMNRYELSVGERWYSQGSEAPSSLLVDYIRVVMLSGAGGEKKPSLLLKAETPFQEDGEWVQYLIASPRYSDDTTEEEFDLGRMMEVARVRPGRPVWDTETFTEEDAVDFLVARLRTCSTAGSGGSRKEEYLIA